MASLLGKAMSLALLLVLVSLGFCYGAIYKVGDERGWTMIDKPDYIAWAKSKIFHVGDELLFQYDKQFHNVLQVNKEDYHKCNAATPTAVFNTGFDSIPIQSDEHLYFICGTPGHCEAGQKVSIKVSKTKAPLRPSPSTDPSPWIEPPPLISKSPPKSQASIAHAAGLCSFLLFSVTLVFNLSGI